jgi:HD-GYP domain-containing protein (c-di-GMP phosphodiesterase class II)
MSTLTTLTSNPSKARLTPGVVDALRLLESMFDTSFHIYNEVGEQLVTVPDSPLRDEGWLLELISTAAHSMRVEIISEGDAVAILSLPLNVVSELPLVAVAPFLTRDVAECTKADAQRVLGCSPEIARAWSRKQNHWPVHLLEKMGREALLRLQDRRHQARLEQHVEQLSNRLASSYEEISLLHSISQNFRISISDEELGQQVLDLLASCVPAERFCMLYLPVAKNNEITYKARTEALLLSYGEGPDCAVPQLLELVDQLGISHGSRPLVLNACPTELEQYLPAGTRQLVIAPIGEDERIFGYVMAFNHRDQFDFGSVEANLFASVGAMLGIHCANRDLYREQDELLASVVRVLTSAIDAKDQYTCGHSDRVARVATRIAQQLGCDKEFLSTIYMSGLLHDIGKIGIDDAVLRKPDRLTDAEYEHIKLHPGLGYKILADIKQLHHVLPAVLHHHEQWDGRGYPCKLVADQIPFIARILAVADAYDAMTSDRPYRPGMPEEKVLDIFRKGSGSQWDPEVIAAFFAAHEDIVNIVDNERAELSLDVQQWI